MKLSNKILLAFLGFIFLYLTAAFAELRMTGVPNSINDENSIAETVNISGVTYIKLEGIDKEISVIGSDRAELEVRSLSGNLLAGLSYKITGDTLTLSRFESAENKIVRISVFVPKAGLKGITINNASAIVRSVQPAQLDIYQHDANVWMTECTIAKMKVTMEKSFLQISATTLDTLSAEAGKSQVNIFTPVGVLQGKITQGTFMRVQEIEQIQVKKDKSSRLMM